RRGMDVYIATNDNHAATIEDFVAAMEEGNGIDLSDFRLWYRQAGTPEITVEDHYDPATRQYELTVSQRVPPTPGQPDKQPMPVPLAMGLLGPNGDEMPTRLDGAMSLLDPDLVGAIRQTLVDSGRDPAFAAEALVLPSELTLADEMKTVDPDAIHAARTTARAELAAALREAFDRAYRDLADPGPYKTDGRSIGRRALRNVCLAYLAAGDAAVGARLAKAQFDLAANMTDVLAALAVLTDIDCPERAAALDAFYRRWESDPLVIA